MRILAHIAEARQAEYIIALLGLFGFIVFWRVLNGPKVAAQVREVARTFVKRFAGFLAPTDVVFHPGHAWARVEDMDSGEIPSLTVFSSICLARRHHIYIYIYIYIYIHRRQTTSWSLLLLSLCGACWLSSSS